MAALTASQESLAALQEGSLFQERSLAAAFLACCARHPDRDAVTHDERTLSYRELAAAAGEVARKLQALELPAHSLVAICVERSSGMVAAMLGTVLAGHTYLPLDPAYPEARLRATLGDARPSALIAEPAGIALFSDLHLRCISLGEAGPLPLMPASQSLDEPTAEAKAEADPDALAYVIYTSGSTGTPKGVMVSHRNVLRLFQSTADWFQFTPDDVWTMFHSFAFDFSVWEMWGALLTGGRLVLVSFGESRDPEQFRALLSRERVTILNQTPTAFRLLDEADRSCSSTAGPLALRMIVFGGEALHFRSLLPWIERHGDSTPHLVNMYGITETTVHATYRRILRHDAEHETGSLLGEPLPDLKLHLLDGKLRPVPSGVAGEIYLEGPGVALGYLHKPDQTAERFPENPFSLHPSPRPRLYRTGDLALRRADGELVYLGRADRQVKINGFRIELAEVEAALMACPAVLQVVAATQPGADSLPRLLAIFTMRPDADSASLAAFAAHVLPAHMRPSLYYPVDRLPMTLNGKLDLSILADLGICKEREAPVCQTQACQNQQARPAALTTLEATVAQAWRSILGCNDVPLEQNFFDAGGTSVQLIALRLDLQRRLDRAIPITWLFQHPTVTSLAARLQQSPEAQLPSAKTEPHPLQNRDARTAWLAAQAQRREAR